MRTPLDADLSQHICGTRTLTGHTRLEEDTTWVGQRHPHAHRARIPATAAGAAPGPHPSTEQHTTSYLVSVDDPIIARSALKHGLREPDTLHAHHHPIRAWDMGDGFTMLLGANRAALVLEIGYIQGVTTIVIVHAMRAREKLLR